MTSFVHRTMTGTKVSARHMRWSFFEAMRQKESDARTKTNTLSVQPMTDTMRAPETLIEAQIVMVLSETGALAYDKLVRRVAGELYQDELRHGAAAIDIGIVGSRLFEGDVIQTIEAANGVLWNIG